MTMRWSRPETIVAQPGGPGEMMRLGCAKPRGGRALNSVVRSPTTGISLTEQGGI